MELPTLVVRVGGRPLVGFVGAPPPAVAFLCDRFEATPPLGDEHPAVVVRFAATPEAPASVLATAGVRVRIDDGGRPVWLLDRHGRRAQLPATADDTDLLVDPQLDATHGGALHQLVERLLEWQVATLGMVALKGAAAVVGGRGVALVGYAGSGKSSVLLALLSRAEAYLAEERLVLAAPATVAAWPGPVRLALGRRYDLGALGTALPTPARAALAAAARAPRRGPAAKVTGRLLRDRWVAVDQASAFPAVARPDGARLDLVVLLGPAQGALRVAPITHDELVAAVGHHVRYLRDVGLSALRALVAGGLPAGTRWALDVPDAALLARLPGLLAGVAGCVAHVPAGTPASAVADALVERLG